LFKSKLHNDPILLCLYRNSRQAKGTGWENNGINWQSTEQTFKQTQQEDRIFGKEYIEKLDKIEEQFSESNAKNTKDKRNRK